MEKKNTDFCGCLYYSANALSRVITKMAEEEFAITGLAPSYGFLLMIANKSPGVQPSEIAERMQLQPSTVTRLIDKMELKGYLERKSEGRASYIFPTEKSGQLDPKLREAWRSLYKRYSLILGEDAGKMLTRDIYTAYRQLNDE